MADEKKDQPSGGGERRSTSTGEQGANARPDRQGAGAAETATATPASQQTRTETGRRGDGGGNRQELSGADRDRGVRTGSRTGGTTEAMAAEFDELGVDARLDNWVGRQRPRLNPLLKPQQVPGPEVGHFGEHADENGDAFLEATGLGNPQGEVLGLRSLGQLGRGEAERDEIEPVEPQPK